MSLQGNTRVKTLITDTKISFQWQKFRKIRTIRTKRMTEETDIPDYLKNVMILTYPPEHTGRF